MATSTKKPRTSVEAVPQLATLPERVTSLEVNVSHIKDQISEVKDDMTSNHTSLVKTLEEMKTASTTQHAELAGKIKDLQTVKDKWMKYGMIALAFAAGAGWIHSANIREVIKLFGL